MIQSNYVPWRGYFDFIDSVDLFVLYDDVPFGQGRKWRNRNRIKTPRGNTWLTVPIHRGPAGTPIDGVAICYTTDWIGSHAEQLHQNYRRARFYRDYVDGFLDVLDKRFTYQSELNEALLRWATSRLSIETTIMRVRDLHHPSGPRETRPLEILARLGATSYLTGPNTLPYTDCCAHRLRGIDIQVKHYCYREYPQCWGAFSQDVSILDLLFNMGSASRQFLKSSVRDTPLSCERCDVGALHANG